MIFIIVFILLIGILCQVAILFKKTDRNALVQEVRQDSKRLQVELDNEKDKLKELTEQYIRLESSNFQFRKNESLLKDAKKANKKIAKRLILVEKDCDQKTIALKNEELKTEALNKALEANQKQLSEINEKSKILDLEKSSLAVQPLEEELEN